MEKHTTEKEHGCGNPKCKHGEHNESSTANKKEEQSGEEYLEQLLRTRAEFDNYRKRTQKDIENARSMGKAELAKELLMFIDSLNAMDCKDQGTVLMKKQFMEIMAKQGMKEINPINQTPDPMIHEIVMVKETEKKEMNGKIGEVISKGYSMAGIVIRNPRVIVMKLMEKGTEKQTDNDAKETGNTEAEEKEEE